MALHLLLSKFHFFYINHN